MYIYIYIDINMYACACLTRSFSKRTHILSLPLIHTYAHTHTHTHTHAYVRTLLSEAQRDEYKAIETHLKERETDTHMWMRHMHSEDFGWYGFLETHSVVQCVVEYCSVSQYDARISRTVGGRSWGFFETRQFL